MEPDRTSPVLIHLDQLARPLPYRHPHHHRTHAATTTKTALTAQCTYDPNWYPTGIQITDQQLEALPIDAYDWHGECNYTLAPKSRE